MFFLLQLIYHIGQGARRASKTVPLIIMFTNIVTKTNEQMFIMYSTVNYPNKHFTNLKQGERWAERFLCRFSNLLYFLM